ncbi:hypothetical protein [Heyndrickxia sporothermodurans]|uniref:hypothetical protein n=1 Tax=Heyndrickxia sporothermodurans TaxID=46224 RepID=UPI002E1F1948|nr:hypothetical protein [Heyndrickxia sporothermodurans]MED3697977.1 hypothetical protein [Heyndrickxia sporothermodurans]
MDNQPSLELLVINYKNTSNEVIFGDIFRIASKYLHKRIARLAERYNIDRDDVESVINLKVFEVARKFDASKGPFMKQLNTAIKFGCIDEMRKDIRREEVTLSHLTANIPEDDLPEFLDKLTPIDFTSSAETQAVTNLQENREQRQLLAKLLSDADEGTRQSASAYLEVGSYDAAAKLLGTNQMNVFRKIKRLARKFDANQMGQISDYFTAPTVTAV